MRRRNDNLYGPVPWTRHPDAFKDIDWAKVFPENREREQHEALEPIEEWAHD